MQFHTAGQNLLYPSALALGRRRRLIKPCTLKSEGTKDVGLIYQRTRFKSLPQATARAALAGGGPWGLL